MERRRDELSYRERVTIACMFYGLYRMGVAVTDFDRVDELCCMDNMHVPWLYSQLTDKMQHCLLTLCNERV